MPRRNCFDPDEDGDIDVRRKIEVDKTCGEREKPCGEKQRSRSRSRSRSRNRIGRSRSRSRSRNRIGRSRSRSRSRNRIGRSRSRSGSYSRNYKSQNCYEDEKTVYRIPPYQYIHVLDKNTNVTSVVIGPQTFVRKDNMRVILGPKEMIVVPPRHYCIVRNPVYRNNEGNPVTDSYGQIKLKHAEREVRLNQDPFPLYPGEILDKAPCPMKVIPANSALRIRAILDFEDEGGVHRTAGDEWLFEGPGTYIPRKETEEIQAVRATIIGINEALRLLARKDCIDRDGVKRVTGEEWQVQKVGAYLPGAYEEVVIIVKAHILTDATALHLIANKSFVDDYGIERKNGENWILTLADTDAHIIHVYETLVAVIDVITLTSRQYCVVLNPHDAEGKPQLGKKKLIKGEKSFFLQPREELEKGIQNVYILGDEEGLILRASESFMNGEVLRQPGDRWMIRGPTEYVPPVEVEVVTKRKAIALDENEGIYVRNIKTGKVTAIHGQTYMLTEEEELWEKLLTPVVEALLYTEKDPVADRSNRVGDQSSPPVQKRDKSRVVTFRVPHNAAVQVYDYKEKKARVVFGPDLVMLGSDEQFTQLSLSGGTPKKPNLIRTLCLLLGPDFCTDKIVVETADHAKLSLQLSYNWHFDVSSKTNEAAAKIFSVPDFIGDFCKSIASKVRGAVAQVPFDELHKKSSQVISSAVFGIESGEVKRSLTFPQNNLVITSVDIQSVEPVDQRTRDSLQRSVQLAIEITTNSQEAAAKHEAERLEQEAKGRLERQRIKDESESETARKNLLELQAQSASVESTGHAKAEAQSRAETSRIEGEMAVQRARLQAEAVAIETESEVNRLKRARSAELSYVDERDKLEITKTDEMAVIEVRKFKELVESIGSDTLLAMATAGPDLQVRMLQALGLKSTLITDGSSPINLFNTANGLVGGDMSMIPTKRRRVDEPGEGSQDGDGDMS